MSSSWNPNSGYTCIQCGVFVPFGSTHTCRNVLTGVSVGSGYNCPHCGQWVSYMSNFVHKCPPTDKSLPIQSKLDDLEQYFELAVRAVKALEGIEKSLRKLAK